MREVRRKKDWANVCFSAYFLRISITGGQSAHSTAKVCELTNQHDGRDVVQCKLLAAIYDAAPIRQERTSLCREHASLLQGNTHQVFLPVASTKSAGRGSSRCLCVLPRGGPERGAPAAPLRRLLVIVLWQNAGVLHPVLLQVCHKLGMRRRHAHIHLVAQTDGRLTALRWGHVAVEEEVRRVRRHLQRGGRAIGGETICRNHHAFSQSL